MIISRFIVAIYLVVLVVLTSLALFVFIGAGHIGLCFNGGVSFGKCLQMEETINTTIKDLVDVVDEDLKNRGVDVLTFQDDVHRLRIRAESLDLEPILASVDNLRDDVQTVYPYLDTIAQEIHNLTLEISALRKDINDLSNRRPTIG